MIGTQPLRTIAWDSIIRKGIGLLALTALAASLALAPLRWELLLLAGASVVLAVLIRPWLGLLIIAVTIPFGPLMPLPIGQANANINELLFLLIIGGWLARGVSRRAVVIPHPPLLLPALLLLGAYLATLPGAWSLKDGLVEWIKWAEGLALYLAVVALLPPRRTPWLIGAILLAGVAEAGLGIYQFVRAIGPSQFAILGRFLRAYGTFRQPNPFGGYMGLIAPVAISLAWWALAEVWRGRRAPGRFRHLMLAAAVTAAAGMVTLGLLASWSRGAWLGFAAALSVIVLARGTKTTGAIALIGATVLSALIVIGYTGGGPVSALQGRMSGLLEYAKFTDPRTIEITDANFPIVQRLAQWWAAWNMFSDHPWLGVGIGNYAAAYPAYALPRWYESLGHAHNYYLNTAAETGLIGLAVYMLVGLAAFIWTARQARRLSGWPQALAIGVLGVLTHLSVHNLFDNLYVQHMILHLALLLGALAVLSMAHVGRRAPGSCDVMAP